MDGVAEELVALLRRNGANDEEIADLASPDATMPIGELLIRSERPSLTLGDVAERLGLEPAEALQVWSALGFPRPTEDGLILGKSEAESLRPLALAWQLFGPDDTIRLARVLGSAIARIAEAVVSVVHNRLAGPALESDPTRVALAQAILAASTMFEPLSDVFEAMLRRQIIASMRPILPSGSSGGDDSVELAVGFVDLVGFTETGQRLSVTDLAGLVDGFEKVAHEVITQNGGRLVKTIGDEVMFVARDPGRACVIALEILAGLDASDLPAARGGIDYGDVLSRSGDYFGPVVNIASRLVSLAEPASILVTERLRRSVTVSGPTPTFSFGETARREVRGLTEPVEVSALVSTPMTPRR